MAMLEKKTGTHVMCEMEEAPRLPMQVCPLCSRMRGVDEFLGGCCVRCDRAAGAVLDEVGIELPPRRV
jgi:hypothetical protein